MMKNLIIHIAFRLKPRLTLIAIKESIEEMLEKEIEKQKTIFPEDFFSLPFEEQNQWFLYLWKLDLSKHQELVEDVFYG